MVTRITGTADNHALEFIRGDDGYWSASVPPDLEDGTYYVTLTAWDGAGNSTYYAKVLMTVDVTGIRFAWQDDRYYVDWMPRYSAQWNTGYCADWEGC